MTEGRFESTYRTEKWDARPHWTKTHLHGDDDIAHVQAHMDAESAPFHDLRADGCFQPVDTRGGAGAAHVRPDDLVRRKVQSMRAGAALNSSLVGRGMGGVPLGLDTVPPQVDAARAALTPRSTKPWTSTKLCGAFSSFEYMPDIRATSPRSSATAQGLVPFRAGGHPSIELGMQPGFLPSPYTSPRYGRGESRLKTGKAPDVEPIRSIASPPAPPRTASSSPRSTRSIPRQAFHVNATSDGCFSARLPHLPEPEPLLTVVQHPRPFFTYAAKTKRSMPIQAPWVAGVQQSAPHPPSRDNLDALRSTVSAVAERGRPQPMTGSLLQQRA